MTDGVTDGVTGLQEDHGAEGRADKVLVQHFPEAGRRRISNT